MTPRVVPDEPAVARGVGKDGDLLVRVQFTLPYKTTFGQNLVVVGNVDLLGNWDACMGFPLTYLDPGIWAGTVELRKQAGNPRFFCMNIITWTATLHFAFR